MIAVAHRLRSVIKCQHRLLLFFCESIADGNAFVPADDKIVLMDNGRIAEEGAPLALLEDEGSRLSKLCDALGKEESAELRRMAGQRDAKS